MVVGGLIISENADLLGSSRTTIPWVYRKSSEVGGEWADWFKMIYQSVEPRHNRNLQEDGLQLQKTPPGRRHSCQLETGNRGHDSCKISKIGQEKIRKLLPGLTSLNSSRNIRMDRTSSHLFLQAFTVRIIAVGAELFFFS